MDMMKKWKYIFVAILTFLSLSAENLICSAQEATASEISETNEVKEKKKVEVADKVIVTKEAFDTTVKVKLGGTIQIRLAENPSTGYTWNFQVFDSDYFDVIGVENFVRDASSGMEGVVGAPEIKVITLKTKEAGTSMLKLSNYRLWEGLGSRIDKMKFTVDIIDTTK